MLFPALWVSHCTTTNHHTWPFFSEAVSRAYIAFNDRFRMWCIISLFLGDADLCQMHFWEDFPCEECLRGTAPTSGWAAPRDDRTSLKEELSNMLPATSQCPPSARGALCCMTVCSLSTAHPQYSPGSVTDSSPKRKNGFPQRQQAVYMQINATHFFRKAIISKNNA